MRYRPQVLATAAFISLSSLTSCVSYVRFEAKELELEKAEALAASRRDSIDLILDDYVIARRAKDQLEHEVDLLNAEVSSSQIQYARLREADADVIDRYERSLSLSTMENAAHRSTRERLTENLLESELDALRAVRSEREMAGSVNQLRVDNQDLRTQLEQHSVEEHERVLGGALPYAELSILRPYGASLVSTSDEGYQYVVRASESMCYPRYDGELSPRGLEFVRDVASLMRGRDQLEIYVHADSKGEGRKDRILAVERAQTSAIVEGLIRLGVDAAGVHAIDESNWEQGVVTSVGSLGSRLNGEVVLVLRVRQGADMSMR